MTNTVDFTPFATGTSANVEDQASYIADSSTLNGFSAGIATSAKVNKAIRQGTFIAAALATFVSNELAEDILDDANLSGFVAKLASALTAATGRYSYSDFTAAGNYTATVPAWASHAEIEITGGGGAGGGCGSAFSGGGGGGGGSSRGMVAVTPGANLAITVGAGGGGGSGQGGSGGTSSITGICSATGGAGGSSSGSTSAGGGGGTATNSGMRNFSGGTGGDGDASTANVPGGQGSSGPYGGGGRTGVGGGVGGPSPGSGGGGAWLSIGNGGNGHDGAVYITFRP